MAPIDAFVALVPQLPKEVEAKNRISRWLSDNAKRATPGLNPLLTVIDPARIDADEMKILNERIQPVKAEGFATFASLAKAAVVDPTKGTPLLTELPEEKSPASRESLEAVYFYKPGCPECSRAKQYFKAVQDEFPLLKLREHNILEASGTLLNQALCQRFSVPSAKHTLSPAIFTQSGFLIRDDISPQSLATLFAKTMTTDKWVRYLHDSFRTMRYAPIAFITGQSGKNVKALLNHGQMLFKQSRLRISTGQLNRLLREAVSRTPPPIHGNRRPKIYYATQVSAQPPTIVLFCSDPQAIERNYQRYLLGCVRDQLHFEEVPIKLYLRKRQQSDERDELGAAAPQVDMSEQPEDSLPEDVLAEESFGDCLLYTSDAADE